MRYAMHQALPGVARAARLVMYIPNRVVGIPVMPTANPSSTTSGNDSSTADESDRSAKYQMALPRPPATGHIASVHRDEDR